MILRYFKQPSNNLENVDMDVCGCGLQNCQNGYFFGPAVRDHYIVHYILDGKGTFKTNGKTFILTKGQGFIIHPNTITFYQADHNTPWTYTWVCFRGLKAENHIKYTGFSVEQPIFTYDKDNYLKDCFTQLAETKKMLRGKDTKQLGLLYLILSKISDVNQVSSQQLESFDKKEIYIKKAIHFIEMNYYRKITISELAHYVGLDRSCLGTLFRQYLNISPQSFLLQFRMNKATELLKNSSFSTAEISRSVGYPDPLRFSKMFKKVKGICPSSYRGNKGIKQSRSKINI